MMDISLLLKSTTCWEKHAAYNELITIHEKTTLFKEFEGSL
jgi:hypothetical protein